MNSSSTGVPLLGQPEDVFEEYALRLSKEVVEEEDSRMLAKIASQEGSSGSRGGKKKAAPAKGTTSDIGRGRDVATVRSVVKGCALQAAALGVRGAMVASQVRGLNSRLVFIAVCVSVCVTFRCFLLVGFG